MSDQPACIATVSLEVPGLRPPEFLRRAKGGARGFWARGERWAAHAGVAAALTATGDDGGLDRFREIRGRANEIAGGGIVGGTQGDPRGRHPRFYGGFSFRPDHRPRALWGSFPRALFHLPAVELEGDASGEAHLRARAVVGAGRDPGQVLEDLRSRLDRLRRDLHPSTDSRTSLAAPATRSVTDRSTWEATVEEALRVIRGGSVTKVVLARTLDVRARGRVDPADVADHLWEANRGSQVFLFEPEPGATIVGAAPETVAKLRHGVFHATAVAGSIRRGTGRQEQRNLAARLLASEKDRSEQRIALDDMVASLEPVARVIRVDEEPHVLTLARIQHLESEIRARVPAGTHVLDLLRILHPTPAVCGLPRDEAMAWLQREEPFERGWYAGPVGAFDVDGNGTFAPALRTGVCVGDSWRLFAGAGIVEGSVPALEWEETRMKFGPMLAALEACGVAFRDAVPAGGP